MEDIAEEGARSTLDVAELPGGSAEDCEAKVVAEVMGSDA